jgi:hypothetical protein
MELADLFASPSWPVNLLSILSWIHFSRSCARDLSTQQGKCESNLISGIAATSPMDSPPFIMAGGAILTIYSPRFTKI